MTKDAQCFSNAHHARNHERFLGVHNSGVEKMTREGVASELKGKKAEAKPKAEEKGGTTDASNGSAGGDAGSGIASVESLKILGDRLMAGQQILTLFI